MINHQKTSNINCSVISNFSSNNDSSCLDRAFKSTIMENWLRRRDMWLLSLTAFGAIILSKAGTFLPGMSPDDYYFALGGQAGDATYNTLVAQGRGLNAIIAMAINGVGASFASIYTFTFFLASAAIALTIAASIILTKNSSTNRIHHYAAAIFAATHPYLTTYFIFRMSLINHAVVYGILFTILWIMSNRYTPWYKGLCILLLTTGSHVSQIILILFAISAGGWAVATYCNEIRRGAHLRQAAGGMISFVLILCSSTILYFLSSMIIRHIIHVKAIAEYSPNLHEGISSVAFISLKLINDILFANDPIIPQWVKFLLIVILATAIILCAKFDFIRAILCIAFLICGLLITVSPMAVSWGGFVPRIFSPAGLCLALVFCLACDMTHVKQSWALSIITFVASLFFCFIGSSIFYQQMVITKWDQYTASSIYNHILQNINESTPIRIVASWPIHSHQLGYSAEGVNESAFSYSWSLPGLFVVSTGEKLNVTEGNQIMCKGVPGWPNPSSVKRLSDGSMLVCMLH